MQAKVREGSMGGRSSTPGGEGVEEGVGCVTQVEFNSGVKVRGSY